MLDLFFAAKLFFTLSSNNLTLTLPSPLGRGNSVSMRGAFSPRELNSCVTFRSFFSLWEKVRMRALLFSWSE